MRKYTVYSDKIKKDISITLISDIHYIPGMNMNFLYKQLDELNKNPTDYLFILGDIVNDSSYTVEELRILQHYLYLLSKTECKIYAILGNHDQLTRKDSDHWIDYYNKDYVNMLKNFDDFTLLEDTLIQDGNIVIAGTRFPGNYYEEKEPTEQYISQMKSKEEINFTEKDTLNILLEHSPVRVFEKKVFESIPGLSNTDLIFSGHMHNGCIPTYIDEFLPSNFGLVSPTIFPVFPKNARGRKEITQNTTGIISVPITTFAAHQGIMQKVNKLFPPVEQKVLIKKR